MCQLFGLNSNLAVTASVSLQRFFQRGGGTDEHGDGWGLAYYQGNQSKLIVDQSPAHNSPRASAIIQQKITSNTFIAHIRKATQGTIDEVNCHPFRRRLWQQDWSFAHNGNLVKTALHSEGEFQPTGETDSEAAFCLILNALVKQFGARRPAAAELGRFLHGLSVQIAQQGTFNFLLSDGHLLIAFCSTQLFWAQHHTHNASLITEQVAHFDFPLHSVAHNQITLVATQPINDDHVWQAFSPQQLSVFAEGQTLFSSNSAELPELNEAVYQQYPALCA